MKHIARDVQFYTETNIDGQTHDILVTIKEARLTEELGVIKLEPVLVDGVYLEKTIVS